MERDRERLASSVAQVHALEREVGSSKRIPKSIEGRQELLAEMSELRKELDGLLQHLSEVGLEEPAQLDALLGALKGPPAFAAEEVRVCVRVCVCVWCVCGVCVCVCVCSIHTYLHINTWCIERPTGVSC